MTDQEISKYNDLLGKIKAEKEKQVQVVLDGFKKEFEPLLEKVKKSKVLEEK